MFATASSSCLLAAAADLDLFGGGGTSEVGAGLSAAVLGGLAKREGGGIVLGGCRYWFSDVAEMGMVGAAAVGGTVGDGDSVPPPSLLFLFAAGVPEVADGDAA